MWKAVLSTQRQRVASLIFVASLCAVATTVVAPSAAFADDPAAKALELASSGAVHFKAGRFPEAARDFEAAYRTNPVDPKNLRYAGRAWEQVGVWDRAISLFERYLQVETSPELRQSIVPRLDKLKSTTPQERAEALAMATIKYPQARLEGEAAQAFERLGDKASLERAIKLYETSRLWAETPAEKSRVDDDINRVRQRITALEKGGDPQQNNQQQNQQNQQNQQPDPKKPVPAQSDTLGTALYIAGGVAIVAGAGLVGVGYMQYGAAIDDNDNGKFKTKTDYDDALGSAETTYIAGAAVAGVGVIVVGVAVVRSLMAPAVTAPAASSGTPAAGASWQLLPRWSQDGVGLTLGGSF